MVKIKCEVNAEANTFEDALLEVQKKLRLLYETSHDKALKDDYHHWDKENCGDVDWYPFTLTTARSRSVFHVVNE